MFDGDRLVETHDDAARAELATADNANGRPGAYTIEALCLTCRDLPTGNCDCP
ncbi:hypothetical protein [Micromonospora sp. CNB394]|uniref:hypothetical protein n=1 Tax=Micromonospora sp. CNB394 TaxID=1169151 RepID=UPI000361BB5E|nr:hypothetical protein [Micromonospora sp. CNB394]